MTEKSLLIVLILESDSDRKFWIRLNSSIAHFKLPIDTWVIGSGSDSKGFRKPAAMKNIGGKR